MQISDQSSSESDIDIKELIGEDTSAHSMAQCQLYTSSSKSGVEDTDAVNVGHSTQETVRNQDERELEEELSLCKPVGEEQLCDWPIVAGNVECAKDSGRSAGDVPRPTRVTRDKKQTGKRKSAPVPDEISGDKNLTKYWLQRYRLFSRFDEGIKMDRGNVTIKMLFLCHLLEHLQTWDKCGFYCVSKKMPVNLLMLTPFWKC